MSKLKKKLEELIPPLRNRTKNLIKNYGDVKVSDVSISQIYGGARSVKCLVCETSLLDPNEGIRFRGYSIPELKAN